MTISKVHPDAPHRHAMKTREGYEIAISNEPDCDICGLHVQSGDYSMSSCMYITHAELAELHDIIGRAIAAADKVRGKHDSPENV